MTLSTPLEREYFDWLIEKANGYNYTYLCEKLYKTKFKWFVPNDDNREQDGRLLRTEFLDEFGILSASAWCLKDCNMFELILGVSVRLSYDSTIEVHEWFLELLSNLKLENYTDYVFDEDVDYDKINAILKRFNNRTYKENGEGGLFPLKSSRENQRNVEIWYQMSAYLMENDLLN